ncbi:hypothetical protein PCL1606_00750 [Pseudomonas chlororaphis]|uniref:Uncharacterized protein n=1 Tax=Pseudomonas chlororaphis TaxID=587753 RepID=A0A0D5XR10_9PSED|nr:hypothetical protein PCL1606_00750 [Pseudomonas chlororaphis]
MVIVRVDRQHLLFSAGCFSCSTVLRRECFWRTAGAAKRGLIWPKYLSEIRPPEQGGAPWRGATRFSRRRALE